MIEEELKTWYLKLKEFDDNNELKPYEQLTPEEKIKYWESKKRADDLFNRYKCFFESQK